MRSLDRSTLRPDGRRLRLSATLPGALALLFAFAAGVGAERTFWGAGGEAGASSSLTDTPEFATLQATWDLIHSEWAVPDEVDDAALLYGAAAGMVDALGDEGHSRFLDPEAASKFAEATQGEFTGVGVEIDVRTGVPVVVAPIDGSPADEAGVRSGDTIVEIDGQETDRLTLDEVADLIRGEAGTSVTLGLLRRGGTAPLEVTLTRREITLEPVSWRMLPGGIAQVRIAGFTAGATEDLKAALTAIRGRGAEAIVLDLRNNPGGLVTEAIGVASQFMAEGATIFQQQGRDGPPQPVKTVGRDGLWLDRPLVVLVNGGSASAAEIVGGALRDQGRATLIGETTFGTGTVLAPFAQPDGSVVLLGTALWLTPDGERLWKEGVTPDAEVELPLDAVPSRPADDASLTEAEWRALDDLQLRKGYEAAAELLSPPAVAGEREGA